VAIEVCQVTSDNARTSHRANLLKDHERLLVVALRLLRLPQVSGQPTQVVEGRPLATAGTHLARDGECLLIVVACLV
jgi:hypothetical protein